MEIFRRLVARGYDVTLDVERFAGSSPGTEDSGVKIRRLAGLPFYYPKVAWTCMRETRADEFDVVVECLNKVPFYSPAYSSVPVLALAHHLFGEVAFAQVPWPVAAVVWLAERFIPFYRKPPFITISESSRDDLIHRGISADRISVSHCGIQRPEVSVVTDVPRRQRVAYVGRLESYKNVDVMLRAMALLGDRFPDAEIVVIGRGGAGPGLERLAEELGISHRTRFTGFISDEERDSLLVESRVCVCASDKEGWGLTVIESNCLGVPVVASRADGLRESVRDGETGFLVEIGGAEGWAGRDGEVLADDALAVRMSRAALEWSHSFDWDVAADDMAAAIDRARGLQ